MFGRLIHKKGERERGQSLVEFALIVPLFLLLMFAIVDFGMGFYSWITVTNAAREGPRLGACGPHPAPLPPRQEATAASPTTRTPPLQPPQPGWTSHKAVYREYTDATFQHLKARAPRDAYLGMLGPVIRAEVGDTILVMFKNNTRSHLSIHAHGVKYDKDSEGALYRDGTPRGDKTDAAVATVGGPTYPCQLPQLAVPGPMVPRCTC